MAPLLENKEGVRITIHSREHLPPHVHASYGDDEALINIKTGEMLKGHISGAKLKMICKWLMEGENQKTIEDNFYKLNPQLRLIATKGKVKSRTKKRRNDHGSK